MKFNDVSDIKNILDIITSLITIFGIPTGLFLYFSTKRKERKEKEYKTFNSLDERHLEFLKICIQNPDLNIYYNIEGEKAILTSDQMNRLLIIYEILVSIMQRAYIMYKDNSNTNRIKQWKGWEEYIKMWMEDERFYNSWKIVGTQWDTEFIEYMNELYLKVQTNKKYKGDKVY